MKHKRKAQGRGHEPALEAPNLGRVDFTDNLAKAAVEPYRSHELYRKTTKNGHPLLRLINQREIHAIALTEHLAERYPGLIAPTQLARKQAAAKLAGYPVTIPEWEDLCERTAVSLADGELVFNDRAAYVLDAFLAATEESRGQAQGGSGRFTEEPDWTAILAGLPVVKDVASNFITWLDHGGSIKRDGPGEISEIGTIKELMLGRARAVADPRNARDVMALLDRSSVNGLFRNPHFGEKTFQTITEKRITAVTAADQGSLSGWEWEAAFLEKGARRNWHTREGRVSDMREFAKKMAMPVATGFDMPHEAELRWISLYGDCVADDQTFQILEHEAPLARVARMLHVARGRHWAMLAKRAADVPANNDTAHGQAEAAKAIEGAEEWNLEGVVSKDILPLLASPAQAIRTQGLRISNVLNTMRRTHAVTM